MSGNPIIEHTIGEIAEVLEDPLQSSDLHVFISKDKFLNIPFDYPFRTDNYGFVYVNKGSFNVLVNLVSHSFKKGDLILITPKSVVHLQKFSPDLEVIAISFTAEFLLKSISNKVEIETMEFLISNSVPLLKYNSVEAKQFKELSRILKEKNTSKDFFSDEIISHTFAVIVYQYASKFKKAYPNHLISNSRYEDIAYRFIKLLNENFKNEHSVSFYADILCITPGHLTKAIKKVSGKTPSQIITDFIIMEAKVLLNSSALSIAQISNELQFSDQSFFGKYFKKYTGHSPLEYRRLNQE